MPKKTSRVLEDELLPEYDFSKLRLVARGPGRAATKGITVSIAPDVASAFPDSNSVNEALRFLVRVTKNGVPENARR